MELNLHLMSRCDNFLGICIWIIGFLSVTSAKLYIYMFHAYILLHLYFQWHHWNHTNMILQCLIEQLDIYYERYVFLQIFN